MAFDRTISAAEELAVGIQLHAMAVETSKTAFANSVVEPLKKAAELIGDETITLGSNPSETAKSLKDAGIAYSDSIAARIHAIADGEEPSIHL